MDDTHLHEQLKRLGLIRGPQGLRARPRRPARPIEALLPGEVQHTAEGPFFLYRETHPLDLWHGGHRLGELLGRPLEGAARLARDPRLGGVAWERIAFIDTETTGLAGGTGTYAFLVGVGLFEEQGFTVHQFFMRDFDEEPAQLQALGRLLDGLEAVVSFNGKSFDLPLLETRFVLARQPPRLTDAPHLDLLLVARRFWKYRLPSCALSSLEREVLGVRRSQADVPGWLIPSLYVDYVRSGDAREMPRIFYHNAQDILSLVTLLARTCALLEAPLPPPQEEELPGEDLFGLGRVLHDLGDLERAEAAYTQAAQSCQAPPLRETAMRHLAYLLKRQERRAEALPWWRRLAEVEGAVYACEELAKHYEWHDPDLEQALAWTRRGIELAQAQPPGPRRRDALADLAHRLARLEGKMAGP